MNPFQRILELVAVPDQSSQHGERALMLGLLEIGAQTDLSMVPGSNPVDASIQSLRAMGVNENCVKLMSHKLNSLRERLSREVL